MFEIRNITLDDAGFYNGGTIYNADMSGGGVVLIVSGTIYIYISGGIICLLSWITK